MYAKNIYETTPIHDYFYQSTYLYQTAEVKFSFTHFNGASQRSQFQSICLYKKLHNCRIGTDTHIGTNI